MIDREKMINGLECCIDYLPGNNPVLKEALDMAIATLKEREPKRGTWARHDIGWDFALFECSECFGETMAAYPFCPHCGIPMEKEVKRDETD